MSALKIPPGIEIHGSVKGSALTTGSGTVQSVRYYDHETYASDGAAAIRALHEIRGILTVVSGPYARTVAVNSDAAIAAASANKLNKNTVGEALDTALQAAKKSAELVEVAAKLTPCVNTVVSWLGESWSHLSKLL